MYPEEFNVATWEFFTLKCVKIRSFCYKLILAALMFLACESAKKPQANTFHP